MSKKGSSSTKKGYSIPDRKTSSMATSGDGRDKNHRTSGGLVEGRDGRGTRDRSKVTVKYPAGYKGPSSQSKRKALEDKLSQHKIRAKEMELERKEKELARRENLLRALQKERGIDDSISDFRSEAGLDNVLEGYVFETFVVGETNRFAFFATQAVAQAPGEAYNPLFIYGDVGLGKTHLLHAVGNFVFDNDPTKKIVYSSVETFTNELIQAIDNEDINGFRAKYRKVDILLIDDVQFLAGKESIQEEFFHTFNELYNHKKQVVLTSDRPPAEIKNLQKRLASRFEGGLITEVKRPNKLTRINILREKMEEREMKVSDEILEFLAENIKENIRELQGALNRVHAFQNLAGEELTIDDAKSILNELLRRRMPKDVKPRSPDSDRDVPLEAVGEVREPPENTPSHGGVTPGQMKTPAQGKGGFSGLGGVMAGNPDNLMVELEEETKRMEDDLEKELKKKGISF